MLEDKNLKEIAKQLKRIADALEGSSYRPLDTPGHKFLDLGPQYPYNSPEADRGVDCNCISAFGICIYILIVLALSYILYGNI